jgi:hypothetical protein
MPPTTSDAEKMSQNDSKASTKTINGSYTGEKRKDDNVINIQLDIGEGQVRVRTRWWKFW